MNTYIINYIHKGREEDAYIYADSFEEANVKFKSLVQTGAPCWELLERIPVTDPDVNSYIDAAEITMRALKIAGGKSSG